MPKKSSNTNNVVNEKLVEESPPSKQTKNKPKEDKPDADKSEDAPAKSTKGKKKPDAPKNTVFSHKLCEEDKLEDTPAKSTKGKKKPEDKPEEDKSKEDKPEEAPAKSTKGKKKSEEDKPDAPKNTVFSHKLCEEDKPDAPKNTVFSHKLCDEAKSTKPTKGKNKDLKVEDEKAKDAKDEKDANIREVNDLEKILHDLDTLRKDKNKTTEEKSIIDNKIASAIDRAHEIINKTRTGVGHNIGNGTFVLDNKILNKPRLVSNLDSDSSESEDSEESDDDMDIKGPVKGLHFTNTDEDTED